MIPPFIKGLFGSGSGSSKQNQAPALRFGLEQLRETEELLRTSWIKPMIRPHVDSILSQMLETLLCVDSLDWTVHRSLARCLSSLITTVGPDLSDAPKICDKLVLAIEVLGNHELDIIKSESLACQQQLHMFSPDYVPLNELVPRLMPALASNECQLRRTSVSFIRQLTQREADILELDRLWRLAYKQLKSSIEPTASFIGRSIITAGLVGSLFHMLDEESDPETDELLRQTIISAVEITGISQLESWISLCKTIITSAADEDIATDTSKNISHSRVSDQVMFGSNESNIRQSNSDTSFDQRISSDDADTNDDAADYDGEQLNVQSTLDSVVAHRSSRWSTRVLAVQILHRLIELCASSDVARHFDSRLASAQSFSVHFGSASSSGIQRTKYLMSHLPDLIRMSFVAATSSIDELRLAGLKALKLVIDLFACIEELEFPGHSILEQYQAQVSSALRTAFSTDEIAPTAPHITAVASQVCSSWICSGVARDINDLQRIHALMVSSISKLEHGNKHNNNNDAINHNETSSNIVNSSSKQQHSESAQNNERLAILRAWTQVYAKAIGGQFEQQPSHIYLNEDNSSNTTSNINDGEGLASLVKPVLPTLSKYWMLAVRDYSLLSLPSKYAPQLPMHEPCFYTIGTLDACRQQFRQVWPDILRANALWLLSNNFKYTDSIMKQLDCDNNVDQQNYDHEKRALDSKKQYFIMLIGSTLWATLCDLRFECSHSYVVSCLTSLSAIVTHPCGSEILLDDGKLCVEFVRALHRVLVTRYSIKCHKHIVRLALTIVQTHFNRLKTSLPSEENDNNNQAFAEPCEELCFVCLEIAAYSVSVCSNNNGNNAKDAPIHAPIIDQKQLNNGSPLAEHIDTPSLELISYMPLLHPKNSAIMACSLQLVKDAVMHKQNTITSSNNNNDMDLKVRSQVIAKTLERIIKNSLECDKSSIDIINTLAVTLVHDALKSKHHMSIGLAVSALASCVIACHANESPKSIDVDQTDAQSVIESCVDLFEKVMATSSCSPDNAIETNFEELSIRLHTLKTLDEQIYAKCSNQIAGRFIRRLVPFKLRCATQMLDSLRNDSQSNDNIVNAQYLCINAVIDCMGRLVDLAQPDKRANVVALYVKLLLDMVGDENQTTVTAKCSKVLRDLEQSVVKLITQLGAKHPSEFKTVVGSNSELRQRLESCLKRRRPPLSSCGTDSLQLNHRKQTNNLANNHTGKSSAAPTIKLKTDFSNFYSDTNKK